MKSTLATLQNKVAHSATLGPRVSIGGASSADTKHLAECIVSEKLLVALARDQWKAVVRGAEAFRSLGVAEGDDLGDVFGCAGKLLEDCAGAFNRYADHHESIRSILKTIRTREEDLEELRKKRKATVARLDTHEKKISKTKVDSPALMNMHQQRASMQSELATLNDDILRSETSLADSKRRSLKSVMNLQFGGMMELAENMTVVSAFGLALAEHIPLATTAPGQSRSAYTSFEATARELEEARLKLQDVVFNPRTADREEQDGAEDRSYHQSETTAGGMDAANTSYGSADFNPVRNSSDAWRDAPSMSSNLSPEYRDKREQQYQGEGSPSYDDYDQNQSSARNSQLYPVGGPDTADSGNNLSVYSGSVDSPVSPGYHADSGDSAAAPDPWVSAKTDYHPQIAGSTDNTYTQSVESQRAGLPPGAASTRYAMMNSNSNSSNVGVVPAPLTMPTPAIRMPSPQMNGMPVFPGYDYDSAPSYSNPADPPGNSANRTLPASAFRRKPQTVNTTTPLVVRRQDDNNRSQDWGEPDSPTA